MEFQFMPSYNHIPNNIWEFTLTKALYVLSLQCLGLNFNISVLLTLILTHFAETKILSSRIFVIDQGIISHSTFDNCCFVVNK